MSEPLPVYTPELIEEICRPRMQLFCSVDLEESTKLKQAKEGHRAQEWYPHLRNFYINFPRSFKARRDEEAQSRRTELPACGLWKMSGDELIFTAEITHRTHAIALMSAFCDSVRKYNEKVGRPDGPLLRVKGSAWIAGFPVTNAVVPLTNGEFDYVGPMMDLGFRLGTRASAEKFVVSVELAWVLTHFESPIDFHCEGRVSVRGVPDKIGYPHIWTDVAALSVGAAEYARIEAECLNRTSMRRQDLERLCAVYIREHGVPDYLPFLADEKSMARPEWYAAQRKMIFDALSKQVAPTQDEDQPEEEELAGKVQVEPDILFNLLHSHEAPVIECMPGEKHRTKAMGAPGLPAQQQKKTAKAKGPNKGRANKKQASRRQRGK